MWKRSEAERLTGLTRYMIQDLCNQNTAGDGLGFWVPAVFKPGYARYDEGDLLAFYLVRQLMRAGFTLKEVEPAAFDMLDSGDAFAGRIASKAERLRVKQARIDAQLQAANMLGRAAECRPDLRLWTIMGGCLAQSALRAVERAAQELPVDAGLETRVGLRLRQAAGLFLRCVCGTEVYAAIWEADDTPSREDEGLLAKWADQVRELLASEDADVAQCLLRCTQSRRLMLRLAQWLAGEKLPASDAQQASGPEEVFALQTLACLLAEKDNGVPFDLVLGKGSVALLSAAVNECIEMGQGDEEGVDA